MDRVILYILPPTKEHLLGAIQPGQRFLQLPPLSQAQRLLLSLQCAYLQSLLGSQALTHLDLAQQGADLVKQALNQPAIPGLHRLRPQVEALPQTTPHLQKSTQPPRFLNLIAGIL